MEFTFLIQGSVSDFFFPPMGFPGGSDSKEYACNAEDLGSIPGSERSPREGNDSLSVFLEALS